MNYLDLFSGIGGFAYGAYLAGMKFDNHLCSDIETYCQKLYKLRFPDSIQLGDITKIDTNFIKEFCLDNPAMIYYTDVIEFMEEFMSGKLKKLTEDQVIESVKMYESGLSLQKIGEYFNVSRQSMWDLLRRRIELRDQKRLGEDNNFYRNGDIANDKAQNILEYAIRKGTIKKLSKCEICGDTGTFKDGRTKIQAHHSDYNKPLDVIWMCQKCHHEWHKNNRAKKLEVREAAGNFIITGGLP
jgi:predicted DNA-binding protein YlxM (UPF0122 family)